MAELGAFRGVWCHALVTLRLLTRCYSPLSDAAPLRVQALPMRQLEFLADPLLDA